LVFSVFDQPSHNLKADTKLDFVLKPLLMGAEWQHFKRIAVPRSPLTVKNETLKGRFGKVSLSSLANKAGGASRINRHWSILKYADAYFYLGCENQSAAADSQSRRNAFSR
jgi:hypothetical protein